MGMFILTIIFAFIAILYLKCHLSRNDSVDKRVAEHTPLRKSAFIGDTVEETMCREKVNKFIKYFICYSFLGILAVFMIIPFYWMIATSLKTETEITLAVPTFWPKQFAISNYPKAIEKLDAWVLICNTLWVGAWSTIGTVITTILAAFAFSRIEFKGREMIFNIFLATMMIPGEMMTISNYITVSKMGGMNTFWAMIVPFLISVYYIYLLRQNFKQIPNELYYAAKVDGTGDFKYLLKIMIPIAMPTLITITILKMMGSWNAYVWPKMIVAGAGKGETTKQLITTGLREAFTSDQQRTLQGQQMAATSVVTAPLLLAFILLRKYIMRGVSRSGIKG